MTIRIKMAGLALACSFISIFTHAHEHNWDGTLNSISTKIIEPNYLNFSKTASQLAVQVTELCANPNQATLTKAQTAFKANLADWQKVQWLNFGPATFFMRYYSFAYWPDKKGIAQRQLRNLIKNNVDTSNDAFWEDASIALKGLTAVESILYRPDLDPIKQPDYCRLLNQITTHHKQSIDDIYSEWKVGKFSEWVFLDEDDNRSLAIATYEQLMQQWLEHIAMVKESKIEQPIGYNGRPNLKLAEFYRSEQALLSIKHNVQLYYDIYHAGTPSLFDIATQEDTKKAQEFDATLLSNITKINNLPDDFFSEELEYEARKIIAKNVITSLSNSQRQLTNLVTQLGFNIGFNSRDGD